jgi:hypothetical protein
VSRSDWCYYGQHLQCSGCTCSTCNCSESAQLARQLARLGPAEYAQLQHAAALELEYFWRTNGYRARPRVEAIA